MATPRNSVKQSVVLVLIRLRNFLAILSPFRLTKINNNKITTNFILPPILFFWELKLCTKFQNPKTTPSGRKVCSGEKKERKIITKIVDTSFRWTPKGSARTPLGPINSGVTQINYFVQIWSWNSACQKILSFCMSCLWIWQYCGVDRQDVLPWSIFLFE